jgi:recombination protein RecR
VISDSPAVERLIEAFRRLPGVGKRSAERLALYLLSAPKDDAYGLSDAIRDARDRIKLCSQCRNLTETDPCPICADPERDRGTVCVVEHPAGTMAIEKGGAYPGVYYVLHGVLNPLDGIGPSELTLDRFFERAARGGMDEVILATNATAEGEATALYVSRELGKLGIRVSRIAHGVPMGSGLEFADEVTLAHAMKGRTPL